MKMTNEEHRLSFMLEGEKEMLANELQSAINKWAYRTGIRYTKDELMIISGVVTGSLFEEE